VWLPPQRTFSPIEPGRPLTAERATHVAAGIERDIASSTIAVRAFRQNVDDQLVTIFGARMSAQPAAHLGHYFVGTAGDVDAQGYSAEWRSSFSDHVHGSVQYSMTTARLSPADGLRYTVLLAPVTLRSGS